ncbi:MAG: anion transporter [Magnetococcales bacterium]|nr:anion transporter [Magnetococcales bacterium]NGZ27057.1 anion transporter [Magnetococcales bacterium]
MIAPLLPWVHAALIMVTLIGVAVGRYPVLRMNRATIALTGAVLLVVSGAITLPQAFQSVDLNTIALLFAMMVINGNLRLAGFFRLVAVRAAGYAHSPRQLLAWVVVSSGVLSAVFLNDTIVLAFTPLVLEVVTILGLHPVPYLIALAVAANIGSTATLIGNPQNMLIGVFSGLEFLPFARALAPVSLVGLAMAWLVVVLVFRRELAFRPLQVPNSIPVRIFRPLLIKSMLATLVLLLALVGGMPVPLAALLAASLLLITRRIKPERVFLEIDWGLLVFFSGLFVVTKAVETAGFGSQLLNALTPLVEGGILAFTLATALMSNLVSNVPAVLLFQPVITSHGNLANDWLTLAMASTLAGNLTLLGSVANLIVAETARIRGVTLSFAAYLRVGPLVTLLTLLWGVHYLG